MAPLGNGSDDSYLVPVELFDKNLSWVPLCVIGLLLNILALYVTTKDTTLKSFAYFIRNMFIANLVFLVTRNMALLHYFSHFYLNWTASRFECSVVNHLQRWWVLYMVASIPMSSIARYIAVAVKGGDEFWLTKRNIFLAMAVGYTVPTVLTLAWWYHGLVEQIVSDKVPVTICGRMFSTKHPWAGPAKKYFSLACYVLSFFFAVLLALNLLKKFTEIKKMSAAAGMESRRDVKKEASMLLCIFLQTLAPLLLTSKRSLQYDWGMDLNIALNLSTICDPLLSLYFVIPYRKILLGYVRRNQNKTSVVPTVTAKSVRTVSTNARRNLPTMATAEEPQDPAENNQKLTIKTLRA